MIPLVLASLDADKMSIMISYVDHQLYIGEQSDAEAPPAFITAVLWTALDIHLSPPPNIVLPDYPSKNIPNPTLSILKWVSPGCPGIFKSTIFWSPVE